MNKVKKPGKREIKREENKKHILNLIIDLILETGKEPTVDEIALESSISRRSIFNYFQDKERLFIELDNAIKERIVQKFPPVFEKNDHSFENFLDQMLTYRTKVYKYITPFRLLAESKKITNDLLRINSKKNLEQDTERMTLFFSSVLKEKKNKENIMKMIMSCLSWNNWYYLRSEIGLSIEESRQIMKQQIKAFCNSSFE